MKALPDSKRDGTPASDKHFGSFVDGAGLADGLARACNQLAKDGYEMISVTPLLGGR